MLKILIVAKWELEAKYDAIYHVGFEAGNVEFFEKELGWLMERINWVNKRIAAVHPMYN